MFSASSPSTCNLFYCAFSILFQYFSVVLSNSFCTLKTVHCYPLASITSFEIFQINHFFFTRLQGLSSSLYVPHILSFKALNIIFIILTFLQHSCEYRSAFIDTIGHWREYFSLEDRGFSSIIIFSFPLSFLLWDAIKCSLQPLDLYFFWINFSHIFYHFFL